MTIRGGVMPTGIRLLGCALALALVTAQALACPEDTDGDGTCDIGDTRRERQAIPAAARHQPAVEAPHQATIAPFKSPVTVTLTYGPDIDRVGIIQDCKAGNSSITCKEF